MTDTGFDPAAIAADAVVLAELDGGTGRERVRIDWLLRRLHGAPDSRRIDGAGNLVWTFGPPPYRLAVLVHVDDVFAEATVRGGLAATTAGGSTDANAALAAGIPAVALGCCEGEDMHAPTERIRADSIVTGARQLRAVLQEVLELTPRAARN